MSKKVPTRARTLAACGVTFVVHFAPASAAEIGESLAEIVVEAKPLNETHQVNVGAFGERDLMDIPIAIQNYSATDIQDSVARTLLDVVKNDPSVQGASIGGAYDNFRLRGFTIDWHNTMRRDGLSLAPYQDVALENIERIDVLKGPSGFLYGFNSPGGSVNYLVKRPTAVPFWTVNAHLSSFDGRYVGIDTSHSTENGVLGVRFNGAYEKVGDFDHAGDLERDFISAAVDVRLSENMVLQLNADYQDSSKMADPLLRADQTARADPLDPDTFIEPPEVDRRDLLSPSWLRYQHRGANFDARLDVEFSDDWFLVVQGNHSQNQRDSAFQDIFDIQPNGDIGFGSAYVSPDEKLTISSAQTFVGGKFATGPIKHDIFAGLSYKKFKDRYNDALFPETSVGNVLNPVQPSEVDIGELPFFEQTAVHEKSVFFSDLVTLTQRWQTLLGVRYIDYVSTRHDATGVKIVEQRERAVVPSVGLIFKPRPEITTYASYSRGLEQGEFAPFFADNAGEQSAPIRSWQVEVGLKAQLTESFDLGVAIFDVEKQAGHVDVGDDFAVFAVDGVQRHRGAEIVTSGRVDNFTLGASLAYLDTELLDVTDPTTLGNRTEGVPEWSGSFSVDYAVRALKGLSLGANVTFTSDRPVDTQNSGFIDGYTIVDASAQYATRIANRPVRMRLNVKNVFDEYYYSSVFFLGGLNVGREREFILSVSTDF